jgi:ribosomal protein L16 Arg81 hydroxylase
MKKEKVVYKEGTFTNYEDKVQKFIICAISRVPEVNTCLSLPDNNEYMMEYYGDELKELSVGVSITNTKDSFDEEFGKKIAYSKAKSNKKSFMLTNRPGFINEDVVNALLANYVKYIQKDPGSVIAGYDAAKKKYFEKKKYVNLAEDMASDTLAAMGALADATSDELETAKKLRKYNII